MGTHGKQENNLSAGKSTGYEKNGAIYGRNFGLTWMTVIAGSLAGVRKIENRPKWQPSAFAGEGDQ
jgi:hypothetical protein